MSIPAWVSGGNTTTDGSVRKYHRAVEQLKKAGTPITEEAVKALYIKFGGLVVDVPSQEQPVLEEKPRRTRKA